MVDIVKAPEAQTVSTSHPLGVFVLDQNGASLQSEGIARVLPQKGSKASHQLIATGVIQ
jgi:hypothetical protein